MKRLFILCLLLFIAFTAYVGRERYRMQKRIFELEQGILRKQEQKDLSEYIKGVKRGLEFKKYPGGHHDP